MRAEEETKEEELMREEEVMTGEVMRDMRILVVQAYQWQVSIGMTTQGDREISGTHLGAVQWKISNGEWHFLALLDTLENGAYHILTVRATMGIGVSLDLPVQGTLEERITGVVVYLILTALVIMAIMESGECHYTAMGVLMTYPCRGQHRDKDRDKVRVRVIGIVMQSQSLLTGLIEFTPNSMRGKGMIITVITAITCTAPTTTII